MASMNSRTVELTHEGGKAKRISPEMRLRRSVMACMLWESTFYEDGKDIATRIQELVKEVDSIKVAGMAVEARTKMNLRHAPLLLVAALDAKGYPVKDLIPEVIQRADELTELPAILKSLKMKMSHQMAKGLAKAFTKFDAYQLAKYNRDGKEFSLRDVMFLTHPKPTSVEQAEVFKKLADNTLESPDTWEVSLSAGKDKKETFERLMQEGKLGGLALLRNIRLMSENGVDGKLIRKAIENMKTDRILPFRFISAQRHNVGYSDVLEKKMLEVAGAKPKLKGKTIVVVDTSGSMSSYISGKSEVSAKDAACGIAMICREMCEESKVYAFANSTKEVANIRGFGLFAAIDSTNVGGGTEIGATIKTINAKEDYDRLILITDEQSRDNIVNPKGKGYIINVAAYENGIGYGNWMHINGFSEAILDYINEYEKSDFAN